MLALKILEVLEPNEGHQVSYRFLLKWDTCQISFNVTELPYLKNKQTPTHPPQTPKPHKRKKAKPKYTHRRREEEKKKKRKGREEDDTKFREVFWET